MKTMTCKELGGACDQEFSAETFDEIAELNKKHAQEMYAKGDEAHTQAMKEMQDIMRSPEALEKWMNEKRKAFDNK